jgi:hypothetical protein
MDHARAHRRPSGGVRVGRHGEALAPPVDAHPKPPEPMGPRCPSNLPTSDGNYCLPDGVFEKTSFSSGGGTICTFNAFVDWGDGTQNDYHWQTGGQVTIRHIYTKPGYWYHINISGTATPPHSCTYINTHYNLEF